MMLPERITLPLEIQAGAHVINTYPCERCQARLDEYAPVSSLEFGLTIFDLSDGRRVYICTELADNPGRSVTNAWPDLAAWLIENIGDTTPEKAVFIEHYYPKSYRFALKMESYDRVIIRWDNRKALSTHWVHLDAKHTL